jgi:hypothetical protein
MPTLANDLVLFLMSLFGNQEAAKEFLSDPERSLEDHGLGGVCSADVDAALPVVLDYAPITVNASSFDRSYNTGGNGAATGGGGAVAVTPPPTGGHGDHEHAVNQLTNVVNNYSYTSSVDDRDTITDQSVNQNIWADGDVEQWFDNDSVVASGDRAVAAGDDVDMDDSNNIEDSYNTDNSNDSSTDNSVNAGRDADVGNTDTDIDDSFNTDLDVDVEDSFNDNSDNSVDNSEETAVDIEDSFNDNSVEVTDNSDNSVEVEDVGNTETNVDVEDSFQDNSETTTVEDNVVVADNELEFTEDNSTNVEVEDVGNTEINAEDDVNL